MPSLPAWTSTTTMQNETSATPARAPCPAPPWVRPGRTLDTAISTARALPRIADAVGGALPLLVDGGLRRGTDVFKALALGATAVLVGRPVVWGLAHAGAAGVAHVLRVLRDELEVAMALTGCATLTDITPASLAPRNDAASKINYC